MCSVISRWFLFGLLLGLAVSHASVFAQGGGVSSSPAQQPADPSAPQTGFPNRIGLGGGDARSTPAQPGAQLVAPQPGIPNRGGQPPVASVPGMTIEKIRQGLDKTITIDYTGQSLREVFNHFRDRTGLALNIDPIVMFQMGVDGDIGGVPMAQVELKAKDEKAGAVLRRLLNSHRLTYVILEGTLLITTEEMAVVRQMRQRVSVDVDEVPLKKAAQELAKKHGVNLVFDPLVKQTVDTPVSLQLDNTGLETALRLLAEMAHLKAVRMGNVMFVTNESKAKKIRDEEPHQFDNPLNPNIPGGGPIPIDGFGGAIRGGVAPGNPGIAVPDGPAPAPPQPGIPQPEDPAQPAPKKVIDIRRDPMPPPPPIPGAAPAVEPRAQPIRRND